MYNGRESFLRHVLYADKKTNFVFGYKSVWTTKNSGSQTVVRAPFEGPRDFLRGTSLANKPLNLNYLSGKGYSSLKVSIETS
jgi:hypothetical protein